MGLLNNLNLLERLHLAGDSGSSSASSSRIRKNLVLKTIGAALIISCFGVAAAADQASNDEPQKSKSNSNQHSIKIETNTGDNQAAAAEAPATPSDNSDSTSYTSVNTNAGSATNSSNSNVSVSVNGQTVEAPANGSTQQVVETPSGNVSVSIQSSSNKGQNSYGSTWTNVHTNTNQSTQIRSNTNESSYTP